MTQEELVHKVCSEMRTMHGLSGCLKCPAKVNTPYGEGVLACRLQARDIINLVREAKVDG